MEGYTVCYTFITLLVFELMSFSALMLFTV